MERRHLVAPALAGVLALTAPQAQAEGTELTFFGLIGTDLIDGGTSLTGGRPGIELGLTRALDASPGVDLHLHRSDGMSTRAVLAFVTEFNLR